MSWGRERRCNTCFESGHNSRTCSKRSSESKEIRAASYRKKHCNYCRETDHNIATCVKKKDDKLIFIGINSSYMHYLNEQFKIHGLGTGAQIQINQFIWDAINRHHTYQMATVAIVDSINIKTTNIRDYDSLYSLMVRPIFPNLIPNQSAYKLTGAEYSAPVLMTEFSEFTASAGSPYDIIHSNKYGKTYTANMLSPADEPFVISSEYLKGDYETHIPYNLKQTEIKVLTENCALDRVDFRCCERKQNEMKKNQDQIVNREKKSLDAVKSF